MAGRGPAPKDPAKRARRNATPATTELTEAPGVNAPKLPGSSGFLKATREWYATWCQSPQASQFTVTDWQRLHMLAPLVDFYFRLAKYGRPPKDVMAEIRLNEAKLGATAEDRMRLHWKPEEKPSETGKPAPRKPRRKDPRLRLVS